MMRAGRRWAVRLVAALAMVLVLVGVTSAVSEAATFVVDRVDSDAGDNDPGDGHCRVPLSVAVTNRCTLRAAMEEANAVVGTDTIVLPAGLVFIQRALPTVSRPLVIVGQGRQDTTIVAFRSPGGDTIGTMISTLANSGVTLHLTGLTVQGTRTDSAGIVGS